MNSVGTLWYYSYANYTICCHQAADSTADLNFRYVIMHVGW